MASGEHGGESSPVCVQAASPVEGRGMQGRAWPRCRHCRHRPVILWTVLSAATPRRPRCRSLACACAPSARHRAGSSTVYIPATLINLMSTRPPREICAARAAAPVVDPLGRATRRLASESRSMAINTLQHLAGYYHSSIGLTHTKCSTGE